MKKEEALFAEAQFFQDGELRVLLKKFFQQEYDKLFLKILQQEPVLEEHWQIIFIIFHFTQAMSLRPVFMMLIVPG